MATYIWSKYKFYHENIVHCHHVMLVGWPQNIPFKNLSKCSSSLQELQSFLRNLVDGKTYWKTITEEKLNKLENECQNKLKTVKLLHVLLIDAALIMGKRGNKMSH